MGGVQPQESQKKEDGYHSRRGKRSVIIIKKIETSIELSQIAMGGTGAYNCGLCKQRGHKQPQCMKILAYGNGVLPLNNVTMRYTLIGRFYSINDSVARRKSDDDRVLMQTVPSGSKGVIIFKRMLINNDLIEPNVIRNICLECTFIMEYGKEHRVYKKQLFTVGSISGFVLSSSGKHVNALF